MLKYGMKSDSELSIELHFIAKGAAPGMTLFDHFMEARRLAWPKRYRHEWTDLMYRNFIENDVTVLMGSASSQKTSHAVEFSLLNYWARPFNTLVVLSTINMDKLDIGVWAELQMLWKSAKDLHPGLYGNILSHKRAITTDNLEDEEGVRDFRTGCICFPEGTTVDTPHGPVSIDQIKKGDVVVNANHTGIVKSVMNRTADKLVRVHLRDERTFDCTPEHPFLTQLGWKSAIDLSTSDWVVSAYEALQVLREGSCRTIPKSEVLLRRVFQETHHMPELRKTSGASGSWGKNCEILLIPMRDGISEEQRSDISSSVSDLQESVFVKTPQPQVLLPSMPGLPTTNTLQELRKRVFGEETTFKTHSFLQSILRFELESSAEDAQAKEANKADSGRNGYLESISRLGSMELSGASFGAEEANAPSTVVQSGHSISRNKTWCRTGPKIPRSLEGGTGQKEGRGASGGWVDHIEILEPRSDKRYSESHGGYRVYNLEVEGHPSYSVNGLLVHNCRPCYVGGKFVGLGILAGLKQDHIIYVADELQFMQESFSKSWPHLFANGNVKIIGSGNPKHDPYDELGKTAEPLGGWNSIPEPTKTTVWETKHMGAKCINLVGTDSPNFKLKPGQPEFPRLISPKFAKRIEHDNEAGVESFEYYRLVKGVMKVSFAASRVIDRPLCIQHKALEKPEWKNDIRKGVYGLDPTYGGEDRCIGIPLWFGLSAEGGMIIHVGPYKVFPINLSIIETDSAEKQIADTLYRELQTHGIESTNVFYDATGKGTIGNAFALKFGYQAPVAVDSGAMPTDRPVRDGLMIFDESTKQLRPKKCREHYSKFVSEMWFSVRYAIEADQVRGLTEDVMMEGCARVYKLTKGNKIEVEPKSDPKAKEDLKRRLGKSPDLFDALAIGFEGARQRGFQIAKLSNDKDGDDSGLSWLTEQASGFRKLLKSKQLATR